MEQAAVKLPGRWGGSKKLHDLFAQIGFVRRKQSARGVPVGHGVVHGAWPQVEPLADCAFADFLYGIKS
ncbi:hypothetical protein D3C85_1335010 [compost metagenome]